MWWTCQIGCTVTTFLGTSKSASIVIEKNGTHSIPAVRILAPNPMPVVRAAGLVLHAEIQVRHDCCYMTHDT